MSLLELARSTALETADFVRQRRPRGRVAVTGTKSSPTDAVTELDRAAEELIRSRILTARPDDGFLGEEGEERHGSSGVRWIVDPIDGTVNFIYGIEASAVAIAAATEQGVQAAFVVNLFTGRAYGAQRGGGAFVEREGGRRALRAPEPPPLAQALVGTGFNYVPRVRAHQAAAMATFLPRVRDIRRIGSAALDLCGLAAGHLDAFVEQGLKPWDLAPGGLIAREAGLELRGLDGEPDERMVIACHPSLMGELADLVRASGL